MDGVELITMERRQKHLTKGPRKGRSKRSSLEQQAENTQWNSLVSANGCAMERHAFTVWRLSNSSSSVSKLGSGWGSRKTPFGNRLRFAGTRRFGSQ